MAKIFTGIVVSNKMQKTVVVRIERKLEHPVYKKIITVHKKLKAHNEKFDLKEGDKVKIKESRPISKEKHFIVIEKIKN
ncbi:30S ribosomal protein S17 [Candidatus Roizmanbacteria bacterium RIFCSPHIGHO2_01_FULL_39_12c]|uniref:Small ribosomal subunit protein uS17 n=1 Tax=Candidatus Roizmanbacteria bacterium RIFCSPHIGHO2_01_FULL_39_12c TaxID=1802031 RepID=A0A1F7GEA1_9BACT|nr:MAG: 30S ribosomal protein S17 [Candidatus Roizmanbacteria bacterium RIFCSPHIGHO2_01_FULL_39_12c]OGK47583.1 MAG: 30S ribosomal protein S17 [Candidatus Roizmanbacteria bacterium RIFCSPLOWO2_01_FULL_40_13]